MARLTPETNELLVQIKINNLEYTGLFNGEFLFTEASITSQSKFNQNKKYWITPVIDLLKNGDKITLNKKTKTKKYEQESFNITID